MVGFLDDDAKKIHHYIHGIKVLGEIRWIIPLAKEMNIDEVIIAIPSANSDSFQKIFKLCKQSKVEER